MNDFLKSKYFLIPSILGLFFLVFFFWLNKAPQLQHLALISVVPKNQSTGVDLFLPITLGFNQEVSASDFSISSVPEATWTVEQKLPNTIVAKSNYAYSPSTNYRLSISHKGQIVDSIGFTTIASQTDQKLLQQIGEEVARDYPLAKITPLKTNSYRVVYSAPLELEITLLSDSITPEQATEEVKSWVIQNGGDAGKHTYKVIPLPSL